MLVKSTPWANKTNSLAQKANFSAIILLRHLVLPIKLQPTLPVNTTRSYIQR